MVEGQLDLHLMLAALGPSVASLLKSFPVEERILTFGLTIDRLEQNLLEVLLPEELRIWHRVEETRPVRETLKERPGGRPD